MENEEIEQALELASGTRLKSEFGSHKTPTAHDVKATAKVIMLFLESLDSDLTVGEIREYLNDR